MGKKIDYVGSRQEWQTHLQSFNSGNLKVADGISLVKEIVKTHLATLPCPFWERFCPRIKETIEYIRIVCDLKSCCFVFERKCSSWSGKFFNLWESWPVQHQKFQTLKSFHCTEIFKENWTHFFWRAASNPWLAMTQSKQFLEGRAIDLKMLQ